MHTLLWSARGCKRIRQLLADRPSDLQVDDAVSMAAAAFGKEALSVYLQTGPRAATQPCYSVSCDLKQRKSETGNQQEERWAGVVGGRVGRSTPDGQTG